LLLLTAPAARGAQRLVLVAGGGERETGVPATQVRLKDPFGVAFAPRGDLFLVELAGGRILQIDPAGVFRVVGGTGEKADKGDGGPAREAAFHSMHALAIDPQGRVYLADTLNHRVRLYDPATGRVGPFAGTGQPGYAGDNGPAAGGQFHGVYCVALSPDSGTLLVTDLENRRVRGVDIASGQLRLIAGNGARGVPDDGARASESPLVDPRAAIADREGRVYVLERGGHALRVVERDGRIRTVVGVGEAGLAGDGGPARAARLKGPKHLCLDQRGNVLIADTDNHVVRRFDPIRGTIERVAGTGEAGAGPPGQDPLQTPLRFPHDVAVDAKGTVYIVDTGNHRLLRLEESPTP
ncbi:MAG: hypothetical protein ACKO3P_00985, partial [Planctomycetaceae bacterium]